jgi:signal transduction histidine kinase
LASCKSIVERHGGTIYVRTDPTVFIVQIPKEPKKAKIRKNLIEKSLLNE